MAGDVATTGTAAADVTQSAPEQGESPASGQDAEVAREAATPRRGRSRPAPATGSPAPAPAAASPASTPPAAPAATPGQAAAGLARHHRGGRGPPPAGPPRRAPRRRDQPGARTADQDGPGDSPQGGHQAHRPRLRGGRALARRPDAQERRPVHHPPARGDHDPGRTRHEHRHPLRRAAARHRGGHRLHPRRTAQGLRRGRGGAGRRGHQAGPGQVRRVPPRPRPCARWWSRCPATSGCW